jgi:hypothetical protein
VEVIKKKAAFLDKLLLREPAHLLTNKNSEDFMTENKQAAAIFYSTFIPVLCDLFRLFRATDWFSHNVFQIQPQRLVSNVLNKEYGGTWNYLDGCDITYV